MTILIDTTAPLIERKPDLVRREGAAFSVVPNYGKFEPTDDVRFEDVGGRLAMMGFAVSPKLYFDADGNGAGEPAAFVQVELTGTAVPAFGDFLVVSGTVP